MYVQENRYILKNTAKVAMEALKGGRLGPAVADHFQWLAMVLRADYYFEYMNALYHRNEATRLVGDITPGYMALPIEVFKKVKDGLERRGFEVKVVFLMRDPVERMLSQMRHFDRLYPWDMETNVKRYYASPQIKIRTTYDQTISKIEQVFPRSNIFYALYEEIFQYADVTVRDLTDFLNVAYAEPNLDKRVNVTDAREEVSEPTRAAVVQYYADTYHFVAERWGERHLAERWPSFKYL